MLNIWKIVDFIYPLLIGIIVLTISIIYDVDYNINNYEKVLDSAITFSSIVTGFLAALLGILVSIRDSEIVKYLFRTKEKGILKYYFYETFTLGFLVLVLSGSMYVLKEYQFNATDIIFYVWVVLTFGFLPSTYRIVSILLSIFFKTNNNHKRPDSNKEQSGRDEIKERLKEK